MNSNWEWWKNLGSPKTVLAPMIERSDLAFRILCRNYGCDIAYTQMLHSQVLIRDPQYRCQFIDSSNDAPIVQLAANDPEIFSQAAVIVSSKCNCVAVDLNLGCPQEMARRGKYGAFMSDQWSLIADMIKAAKRNISVPVTAKIRIFEDPKKSIEYARSLVAAGISLLAVHGRTRQQRGALTGMASWEQIKLIREAVPEVPVIANGNIRYYSDIDLCIEKTGVNAVMSAETILHVPTLFSQEHESNPPKILDITREYMTIVQELKTEGNKYGTISHTPLGVVRGHLFKYLYPILCNRPEWREVFARCKSIEELSKTVDKIECLINEGVIPEECSYCIPRERGEAVKLIEPGVDLKNVWLEDFSGFDEELSFDCLLGSS